MMNKNNENSHSAETVTSNPPIRLKNIIPFSSMHHFSTSEQCCLLFFVLFIPLFLLFPDMFEDEPFRPFSKIGFMLMGCSLFIFFFYSTYHRVVEIQWKNIVISEQGIQFLKFDNSKLKLIKQASINQISIKYQKRKNNVSSVYVSPRKRRVTTKTTYGVDIFVKGKYFFYHFPNCFLIQPRDIDLKEQKLDKFASHLSKFFPIKIKNIRWGNRIKLVAFPLFILGVLFAVNIL